MKDLFAAMLLFVFWFGLLFLSEQIAQTDRPYFIKRASELDGQSCTVLHNYASMSTFEKHLMCASATIDGKQKILLNQWYGYGRNPKWSNLRAGQKIRIFIKPGITDSKVVLHDVIEALGFETLK